MKNIHHVLFFIIMYLTEVNNVGKIESEFSNRTSSGWNERWIRLGEEERDIRGRRMREKL